MGHQRTLLPSAPRRERPLPLSPNYTILLTCALMGFLCVYDLPSHDFLAMTGFRPSGFPPRSYPCAYSADRMGHCTPFLLGNHLTVSGSDDRRAASSDSHILFSRINLVFVGNDRIEIRDLGLRKSNPFAIPKSIQSPILYRHFPQKSMTVLPEFSKISCKLQMRVIVILRFSTFVLNCIGRNSRCK